MSITLNETIITPKTRSSGSGVYSMTAGEELEIKAPDDVLAVTVPGDESWEVTLVVSIVKTTIT